MKTIYILNWHNTYNYWTFMMLINFMSYTYNLSQDKDIKFIVDFLNLDDINRLKKEFNNDKIQVEFLTSEKNLPAINIWDKFKKLGFMLTKFQKEILNYKPDSVVVLWGDDFSEYYGKVAIAIYMKILISLNKKVPLFFIGQTIWPFSTYNIKIAHELFSNVDITLRDTLCETYMKEVIKVDDSRLKCYSDLAFLDLPLQNTLSTKETYKLIDNEYIVFVASGLYFKYTHDENLYTQELIKIIKHVEEKFPNRKIAFLGHVLLPEVANDNKIIDNIKNILWESEKYIYIQDKMLASEAREILSGGYMTLTGRMHAAISTLQTGKPAISLSYSVKYKWIISDDMQLPELVVESKWHDLWEKWEVFTKTVEAIDYVDSHYGELQSKIASSVETGKNLSIENIKYFIDKAL